MIHNKVVELSIVENFIKSNYLFLICAGVPPLMPNGPAIKGGCVTRRSIRAESRLFSQDVVTVRGGYGTCFCSQSRKLVGHYAYRGTMLLNDWYLEIVTNVTK